MMDSALGRVCAKRFANETGTIESFAPHIIKVGCDNWLKSGSSPFSGFAGRLRRNIALRVPSLIIKS